MIAADTQSKIIALAQAHPASRIDWPGKGVAPPGYMPGIACAYAQVYRGLAANPFVGEMAKANTHDAAHDALSWYSRRFDVADMINQISGADTLRHLAALVAGLGMRESGGGWDIGHDTTAGRETAITAETGVWQMSENIFEATPLLPELYFSLLGGYQKTPTTGLADVFYKGEKIRPASMENVGSGAGAEFQKNLKAYPALAFWLAMLGLRYVRKHWGPINRGEVTLEPAVDDLLKQVQAIVDAEAAVA